MDDCDRSLLDVFAGQALTGMLARHGSICVGCETADSDSFTDKIAKAAYAIARAMLAERERVSATDPT
jgi:hypothetical protein